MAGKRRKAQPSRGTSTKKLPAGRAAKENPNAVKKRTPISSTFDITARDRKHHVLNLTPIGSQECADLLTKKGVRIEGSFEGKDDYEPKKLNNIITLKLPTNIKDIRGDDLIDVGAINDDDANQDYSNMKKQHASAFPVKYFRRNDDEYFATTRIGRVNFNSSSKEISRALADVGITNDAEAWMIVLPDEHFVHIHGKQVDANERLPLCHGAVVSFYGQMQYAYRVDIQSSVLVQKKNALARIDDVLQGHKECCICFEPFDDSDHQPIIGSCGDVICQTCLGTHHAVLLNSKPRIRYLNCPFCRKERTFDTQNPVKHRLLSQILQARAPESKFEEEEEEENASKMGHTQVASKPPSSETGVAALNGKSEEIDSDKEQLRKSNEALVSENAQLRRRIEELEAAANARSRIVGRNQEIIEIRDDDEPDNGTNEGSESDTLEQHEQVDESSNTYDIVKSKWACKKCTLQNEYRRHRCELCNSPKE